MNTDLVVAVFAVREVVNGIATGKVGTAYPVSDDLLLTSGHVVRHAAWDHGCGLRVRRHVSDSTFDHGDNWIAIDRSEVIFPQDKSLDVALIRTPQTLKATWPWGRLVDKRPNANDQWASCGFPAASRCDGVRQAEGFRGGAYPVGAAATSFEIDVAVGPDTEDGWGGVSGMPVFFGGEILGVVSGVRNDFANRKLNAVAVWRILEDEAIQKALARPDNERLQFAREDLTRVLGQSSTFRRFIAEQIDCTPKDFEAGPTLQEVVEAVLGLDPREICRLASEAKVVLGETKASGDKLTPAAVATELVCITLPALIAVEDVERVRGHVGSPDDPLVENVASLSTVAEIIMAGADLGKAAFVPSSNPRGFPRGRYSIPPPPEAGRSAPGETAYRDLLAALADQLEATADIALEAEFTRYLEGRFGDPETVEFLQTEKAIHEHIRDELVEDQKKNRRTFYVVVVLPTDEGRRQRRLNEIRRLKQNFPEIMFLSLERDDRKRLEQTRTYGPLRSIFPGPTVEQRGVMDAVSGH